MTEKKSVKVLDVLRMLADYKPKTLLVALEDQEDQLHTICVGSDSDPDSVDGSAAIKWLGMVEVLKDDVLNFYYKNTDPGPDRRDDYDVN